MEFLFIFVVVAVIAIVAHAKGAKRTKAAWRKIAHDLKLNYLDRSEPALTGKFNDHSVRVKVYTESHGKTSQTYTGFQIELERAIKVDFQLGRQGLMQSMIGMIGGTDIQVGHSEFDKAIVVKGRDEKAVQAFFQSDRARNGCLTLFRKSRYSKVKITNNAVEVSISGKLMHSAEVKPVLNQLLSIVLLLEDEGAGTTKKLPPPLPKKKEKKEKKKIKLVVPEEWHEANEPIEPEPRPVQETPPAEVVSEAVEEPAIDPEPEPAVEVFTPVPDNAVSIDFVADSLFEEKLGKYQAGKLFDELFKGEEIVWRGELKSIEHSSSDRFYSRDSGWIAIVDTGLNRSKIKYRIGQERMEALKSKNPGTIEIKGSLVKFDPFTATLYVDSGEPGESPELATGTKIISYAERMKSERRSRPGEVKRYSSES